jgi:hypothetical protein
MPPEPEDELERIFAADEAAIEDDGFTRRVMEQAGPARPWRRAVIFGAGFAGFGFAIGGIVEVTSKLPADWLQLPDITGAKGVNLGQAVQSASADPIQLAIVAIVAGISFLIAAIAVQSR